MIFQSTPPRGKRRTMLHTYRQQVVLISQQCVCHVTSKKEDKIVSLLYYQKYHTVVLLIGPVQDWTMSGCRLKSEIKKEHDTCKEPSQTVFCSCVHLMPLELVPAWTPIDCLFEARFKDIGGCLICSNDTVCTGFVVQRNMTKVLQHRQ